MPEVYSRQGYVREELSTPAQITAFERSTGKLHEPSHYDGKNSHAAEKALTAPAEPGYKRDPDLTKRLVQAIS